MEAWPFSGELECLKRTLQTYYEQNRLQGEGTTMLKLKANEIKTSGLMRGKQHNLQSRSVRRVHKTLMKSKNEVEKWIFILLVQTWKYDRNTSLCLNGLAITQAPIQGYKRVLIYSRYKFKKLWNYAKILKPKSTLKSAEGHFQMQNVCKLTSEPKDSNF